MSISAPRLSQSRHGVFVFRFLVPPAFADQLGKKELRRSLGTKDSGTAKVIALHLNALIENALKSLPAKDAMDEIKKLLNAASHGWVVRTQNLSFETDGSPQDAADLAARLTTGDLRELLEQDIARGHSLSVTQSPALPAYVSPSALLHESVAVPYRPLTIDKAIEGYLGDDDMDCRMGAKEPGGSQHEGTSAAKPLPLRPDVPRQEGESAVKSAVQVEAPSKQTAPPSSARKKASDDKRTTMKVFKEFIESGATTGLSLESFVHEIQAHDVENFLTYYARRSPQKLKKNNRAVNSLASSDKADAQSLPLAFQDKGFQENEVLSQSTLDKQASNFNTLIDYCRKRGALHSTSTLVGSHFRKDLRDAVVQLTKRNRKSGSYAAFEHQELQQLFEPQPYFWCAGGQPDYFWAPLLALHMGFRAKEIATLTLKSIREFSEDGLHAIQLYEDSTKNLNSSRVVPIPDRLIELGFLEYVQFLHEKIRGLPADQQANFPLFPTVDHASTTFASDPGKNISRFFSCYRRMPRFELDLNTKVFHSFRHTVVSLLEALKVDVKAQMAIVGHAEGEDGKKSASDHWLGRSRSSMLQTNMRYTKQVKGFDTLSSLQHNKQFLNQCCAMYELDYTGLRKAGKTVQSLLVCNEDTVQQWKGGFRSNKKKLIELLPSEVVPTDMHKVDQFNWR